MANFRLLPADGNRVQIGLIGAPGRSQPSQSQSNNKQSISDHKVITQVDNQNGDHHLRITRYNETNETTTKTTQKSESFAGGIGATFGKDLVSLDFKNQRTRLILGAEGMLGLTASQHRTTVSTQTEGSQTKVQIKDHINEKGEVYQHQEHRNIQDNWANQSSQTDKELKWQFQARVGTSLGVQHRFDKLTAQADVLGGYHLTAHAPYIGSRVSVITNSGWGAYGQVTKTMKADETLQGEVGVLFKF